MRYRHLIAGTVRRFRTREAVVCGDTARTFGEVHERACRLSNALAERGVRPGDRVAVLLPNCAEYVEVDVALAQAGYVRVSLNTRAPLHQQRSIVEDAEAVALIHHAELQEAADAALGAAAEVRAVACLGGPGHGAAEDYEEMLASASAEPPDADPEPESTYCLFYTSGTTGRPKGVVLSHRAYHAVAINLLVEFAPVRAGDRIVLTQPLSHGGGFFLLPWLMSGATSVVMERFDPVRCLELAERHEATALKVVPTMLLQILAAGLEPPRLPALRQVIYGASPMPAKQLGDLIERFGGVFVGLYGQAEAPMSIAVLPEEDHVPGGRRLSSAGRPWRGVEVDVVDEDGRSVAPGEQGEVIVRGPQLMDGYWRQPELTAAVLREDGWLRTRDMAEVDDEGYLYLLGRTDEMINSGGFNIAPRVVEEVLNGHPAILESAVMGLPDELLGEQVAAFVSLRPGSDVSPGDIIDYTRDALGYQKPRTVRIVDRLPRNAYGKVVMGELRELAERGAPA